MTKRRNGEGTRRKKQGRDLIEARIPYQNEFGQRVYKSLYAKTDELLDDKILDFKMSLKSGSPAEQTTMTLGDWAKIWVAEHLENYMNWRPTTKELYQSLSENHIEKGALSRTRLKDIDGTHINNFLSERKSFGLSNSSLRTLHTVLKHQLDTAVSRELITSNPVKNSSRPSKSQKEAAWLTTEEVDAVLDELHHSKNRHLSIVEFILLTGVRRGEALALTWNDVDLVKGTLRIRATMTRTRGFYGRTPTKTKNGNRPIHFQDSLGDLLKAIKHQQKVSRMAAGNKWVQTNHVFTTMFGTPVDGRAVYRSVSIAAEKALSHRAGVHTLRHTVATHLLESGQELPHIVSRTLGHSSLAVTVDLYGHVNPETQKKVMSELDSLVRVRSASQEKADLRIISK